MPEHLEVLPLNIPNIEELTSHIKDASDRFEPALNTSLNTCSATALGPEFRLALKQAALREASKYLNLPVSMQKLPGFDRY
jgi:hypothetical protein